MEDVSDPSKFGTLPGPVAPASVKNLTAQLEFADIVAVNGQPAQGMVISYFRGIGLTASDPGILDALRTAIGNRHLEILGQDGTPVGTIMHTGFGGGLAPPGSSLGAGSGNWAIAGGTGAFLGVRGQFNDFGSAIPGGIPARTASITEDPANPHFS